MRGYIPALLSFGLVALPAKAQAPDSVRSGSAVPLSIQIQQLRQELDSLRSAPAGMNSVSSDDLDALEDHIDKRITELENKIDAVSRATAPTVLNPKIVAFMNAAARIDNHEVRDARGTSTISDRPFLRTVELELTSAVDPYAEAVTIISLEDQAGRGFGVDAEEAYGLIKRLPILESAPLGMKIKIGRYRAPIGVGNMIHMHDLPWTTRPLAISTYLGTDHGEFFESGFNPVGIDVNFFLPSPIPGSTFEANLDAVRAGELGASLGNSGTQPGYIGHLTLSRDWNNEHLLVLGASGYKEDGIANTGLLAADVTYKWAPAEERESRSIVAGGEFFSVQRTASDSLGTSVTASPYGWFSYLQYQLSYWTYLGVRYDWLQEPVDVHKVTHMWSAYLTYYTTEFLRFRIGMQQKVSDTLPPGMNNVTSGLFEVNFVFGSHPTEPYWVNR